MDEADGLIFAWRLGDGAAAVGGAELDAVWAAGDPLWVHLDRTQPGVGAWLERVGGIDPGIVEALLAPETRPRVVTHDDGVLVNLRGANLNPGAEPEDMVSVRTWIWGQRIVTLRGPRLVAADDVAAELGAGRGPSTPQGVLVALAEALAARIRPVVTAIEDELDDFEEALIDEGTPVPSAARISGVRRRAIALRRHLAPQRDVMLRLWSGNELRLDDDGRATLRETADGFTRFVEDLDAARERGSVTHEEVTERLSLRMNRTMYLLSIVATVFLPLSFITGLLGINVGGIPGTASAWAFTVVCVALGILLVVELVLFRRWHWL